jgi:hypothetical protein
MYRRVGRSKGNMKNGVAVLFERKWQNDCETYAISPSNGIDRESIFGFRHGWVMRVQLNWALVARPGTSNHDGLPYLPPRVSLFDPVVSRSRHSFAFVTRLHATVTRPVTRVELSRSRSIFRRRAAIRLPSPLRLAPLNSKYFFSLSLCSILSSSS